MHAADIVLRRRRRAPQGGMVWLPSFLAGLVAWYRADQGVFKDTGLTTPAVANGDPVGGWKDQSGNGNHLTQATGTKQPALTIPGKHGFPIVTFDGVDDFLKTAAFAWNIPATVFVVVNATFVNNSVVFDGLANNSLSVFEGTGPIFRTYNGAFGPTINFTSGNWYVLNTYWDSTASAAFIQENAGTKSTGTSGTSNPGGLTLGISGGGGNPGTIQVGEVVAVSGKLSAANEVLMLGYLNSRWGAY